MKRLLLIECQKLWLNKLSRSLIIIYFFLLTSIALIATLEFELGPIKLNIADEGIFNFPYIWHFNTYIASLFKLFLKTLIDSMNLPSLFTFKLETVAFINSLIFLLFLKSSKNTSPNLSLLPVRAV